MTNYFCFGPNKFEAGPKFKMLITKLYIYFITELFSQTYLLDFPTLQEPDKIIQAYNYTLKKLLIEILKLPKIFLTIEDS